MISSSKFENFINYCNATLKEKKLRKCIFSGEYDISEKFYNYHPIHQSYGHWILQIDFTFFKYKEKFYSIGFQYQNETCKINCARCGVFYNTSTPDEIDDFIDIFRKNAPDDYRVNLPQTRAYVSMSKKFKGIEKLPDDVFSKELFSKMENSIKIIEKIKNNCIQKGCKFY